MQLKNLVLLVKSGVTDKLKISVLIMNLGSGKFSGSAGQKLTGLKRLFRVGLWLGRLSKKAGRHISNMKIAIFTTQIKFTAQENRCQNKYEPGMENRRNKFCFV